MTTAIFKTGMNRSILNKDFFQDILDRAFGPNICQTIAWSEQELDSSASILSNISSGDGDDDEDDDEYSKDDSSSPKQDSSGCVSAEPCPMNDMTGHFLYKINYNTFISNKDIPSNPQQSRFISISGTTATGAELRYLAEEELWVVIKSKPIDTALIELTNIMAQLHGGRMADQYDQVKDLTGFRNSHIREIELAELAWQVGGAMENISTKVYNVLRNDAQQLYALCLEYLNPEIGNITHMNSTDEALKTWSPDDIHLVLKDLASFHAQFLGKEDKLQRMSFLENPSRSMMKVLRPAYEAMVETNRENDPAIFSRFMTQSMLDYLADSDKHWKILENHPRTLIHGDFNTRNICMRVDQRTGSKNLCAYDWELACCHVPQRDVVEFLSFVLPPGSGDWSHYIEYHRLALKASYERLQRSDSEYPSLKIPSSRDYLNVAKIALMDFASQRIAMYGISNSFKQVAWLPRIVSSVEKQIKRLGPLGQHQDRVVQHSKL
ncbi:hypothetical protein BGZ46_001447 [Entomortierella lignicola]|nr:hypothetical protein BGZ46_001447 [Entomortierella lignicola]